MELGAFLLREQLSMKSTGRGANGARYEVVATIDRGGMGELFLAKQYSPATPPRYVVVKRILPTLLEDEKYVKMFIAEADVMSRLDHPNIVRLLDRPTFDGITCLALEYVRGRNVYQILAELGDRRMEPVLVLKVMSQVLRGLDYAHKFQLEDGRPLNLVHRDVTPGNVLVSFQGDVKLADFGIAKHEMSSVLTTVGIVKGKARYLSPEQVVGDPATPRSDVFSAACVVLEMLTGKPLFDAPSVPKTLYAIVNGDHPAVETLVPFHAPLLVQLLTRALATNARQRLGSAKEFAEGLEAAARVLGRPSDARTLGLYLRQLFGEPEGQPPQSDSEATARPEVEEDAGQSEETAPQGPRLPLDRAALTLEEEADDMRTEIAGALAPRPLLLGAGDPDATTAARDSAYGSTVPPEAVTLGNAHPRVSPENTNPHEVDEALSVLGWLQTRHPDLRADATDPAEAPRPPESSPSAAPEIRPPKSRALFVTTVFLAGLVLGVAGTLSAQAWRPHLLLALRLAEPTRAPGSAERPPELEPPEPRSLDRVPTTSTATVVALEGPGLEAPPVAPVEAPSVEREASASAEGTALVEGAPGWLDLLEPKGATVRLDGVWLKQRVPFRDLELRPGRHRIRIVTKAARQELTFSLEPGERVDLTRNVKRKFAAPR